MQTQLNLDEYTNSAKWEVIHDGDTGLYMVKNAKGRQMPGMFTSRIFAEHHLVAYLEDCQSNVKKMNDGKRAKKEQAA